MEPPPPIFLLTHLPSGRAAARVRRLDDVWAKGRGVIGLSALSPGEGFWLPRVNAVHTLFVRFPLDLIFLDGEFRTVRVALGARPWRPLFYGPGAAHTVELGAGSLQRLLRPPAPGDPWALTPI